MTENSFQIFEEEPDHKFRTEIPNIVFQLGLTPHEFMLYCYYKKVAGDKGCCNQFRTSIEKATGISPSKQKEINQKLRRNFDELGGKSLIRVFHTKRENGNNGPTQILIVDIWRQNGNHHRRVGQDLAGVSHNLAGVSQELAPKEEPIKKNHNNNNRAAPSPSASPPPAESVVVFSCLDEIPIEDSLKQKLCKEFNESSIQKGVDSYFECDDVIVNVFGWLRSAIKAGGYNKTPSSEERVQKNKEWAQKALKPYEGKLLGSYQCVVLNNSIEFTSVTKCVSFEYEDSSFETKVRKFWNYLCSLFNKNPVNAVMGATT